MTGAAGGAFEHRDPPSDETWTRALHALNATLRHWETRTGG
ncbi:MAG TPA: hypothetical protein VFH10_11350 [Nocardioides sp.]|nr:hypothetical protein [Nocardioides sp.]HET6653228.1 hypothetical protein [Nocardioides sp.]